MHILSLTVLNAVNQVETLNYLIEDHMRSMLTGTHPAADLWTRDDRFHFTTSDDVYVAWPKSRFINVAIAPYTPPAPQKDADEAKLS